MKITDFVTVLDSEFYTGVPDSLLQPLCNYLMQTYGICAQHHVIGANEGNCVGLAAGYYLATGKPAVVYLQNSGQGNIINPVASLLNDKVYGIPCIFVVGWRGEPNVHDEPQHAYQGLVTVRLMEDMDIATFVISKETTQPELDACMENFRKHLAIGKQVAFIVRKGALENPEKVTYSNDFSLIREQVIEKIVAAANEDMIVSTTGKISRELFEIREKNYQSHEFDFLTVGSMGHSSSIALGLASQLPNRRIWCVDGDGAMLMHMGALVTIAQMAPKNLVHIVLNNGAHESVGGLPTAGKELNLSEIARCCGYRYVRAVSDEEGLDSALKELAAQVGPAFLEVKVSIASRADLGRPTVAAAENCSQFMRSIAANRV